MHLHRRNLLASAALAAGLLGLHGQAWAQAGTLRFVPHANLTVLDPVWTTAYVTRNHAYMVYDTLFAVNQKGEVKPQMVDKWSTSKDGKTWTFTLRDGLAFHDDKPVTSEDVIASLKRWAQRDAMGGVLGKFIAGYEAVDAKTFKINLNEPCGIVLDALGKPSSNVPFIMPARIAATPATEQIKETIGSGPFVFKADEFKPGEKVVYLKNTKYKPRAEPIDGLTGGKVVNVDKVEWVIIRDTQTQFNAIKAGEVDWVEQPAFEQISQLKANPELRVEDFAVGGLGYILRFNHLHKPFDNVKIRQAAMVAIGQEAYLKTQVGVPGLYRYCPSIYLCTGTYSSDKTGYFTGVANPQKAQAMLKEAGYDGTPVTLMRPTDLASIAKIPLVAKQQLEAAGFKVDFQQMDWASLLARRAKKDPPSGGGWNIFLTAWTAGDLENPLGQAMLNARGDKGWFGWQDETRIEALKDKFARATTLPEKKQLAEQIQLMAIETATHAPLGQYQSPSVVRKNITGLVPVNAGVPLLWGVKKG
ncbi:ABC-type dipeptide transport system, periplasmic component [Burkholderiales bacterium JOSHI_001]|nr:ABC-type dipeptide transport system, periplasmic component [Burkholderiales bacterium JOSHI_001]